MTAAAVLAPMAEPEDQGSPLDQWQHLRAAYDAARAAECAHDAVHIAPHVSDDLPVGPERNTAIDRITPAVWAESERLGGLRHDLEDALFKLPSPCVEAFALKVAICREDDRGLDGLDHILVREAKAIMVSGLPLAFALPDPTLADLIAAHQHARASSEQFVREVVEPAEKAFDEAEKLLAHYVTKDTFETTSGERVSLSTASPSAVAMARRLVPATPSHRENDEWLAVMTKLVAAADLRDDEVRRLRASFRLPAIYRLETALAARDTKALTAVIEHPARTLADLRTKVDHVVADGAWELPATSIAIIADVRRLACVV